MVKVMAPKTIILSAVDKELSLQAIADNLKANPQQVEGAFSVSNGTDTGTLSFFKKQHYRVSWFVIKTRKETVYVFTDEGKFKFAGKLRTKLGKNVLEIYDDMFFTVLSRLTDSLEWTVNFSAICTR
jgi:hypothetical protein